MPRFSLLPPSLQRALRLLSICFVVCLCSAGAWASTLTVTTTIDFNTGFCGTTCSLRDAIANAHDGDTIVFQNGVTGTITLVSGVMDIDASITITGPGANLLTIDGNNSTSAFVIGTFSTPTVSISGLTIANGNSNDAGGAILLGSPVDSAVQSTLTVTNCAFLNNTAKNAGGAIYSTENLTVTGSLFSGNSSQGGGAIYYTTYVAGGTTVVTSSTFERNSAGAGGGAINANGNATVTNNSFVDNFASEGGGIDLEPFAVVKLTVSNNIISGNTASDHGAGLSGLNGDGGPQVDADHNVYYHNLTNGSEDNCNSCNYNTNAVSASSNPLTLPLAYYGGFTETYLPQPGSAAICAGSASATKLPSTDQRGFAVSSSFCSNGGVDAGADQSNYLTVTSLSDASVTSCGDGNPCSLRGAFETLFTFGATNGDIDFASGLVSANSPGTITLGSALPAINGQVSIIGPGASSLTISGNTSTSVGSVFVVNSGSQALLDGLTIANGNSSGNGGGIYNSGTVTLLDSMLDVSFAGGDGGGIYNGGTLYLMDSTVAFNSAPLGGGIYNSGTMTLTESTVAMNGFIAPVINGGGIFLDGGSIALYDSTVSSNTAQCTVSGGGCDGSSGFGGGIAVNSGSLILANSIVAGNAANGGGADIYGSYADGGGNIANVGNPQLSLLQQNGIGSPLETMIPLPGSAAICGGLATNIPSGTTTDERGFPNTNTHYTGYTSASPCVDVGAVQTNYTSVKWVEQPTDTTMGATISPLPSVEVLEKDTLLGSNNTDVIPGIPITLTLDGGLTLSSGLLTEPASGIGTIATFSGLVPSSAGSGFSFSTDAITVVGSDTLASVSSSEFKVNPPSPPIIAASFSPNPIALGGSSTLTITMTNPAGNLVSLTGMGFDDELPAGLSTGSPVGNNCGNIVSVAPGAIVLSGISLAPGSSCAVTVNITPTEYGAFQDSSGVVTSNEAGNGTAAIATLTVTGSSPTVTGISPSSGSWAGGTTVTISGTHLNAASATVNFGAAAATHVTVVNATTITATSPTGGGTVDVTVTTPSGTSATSPADQFSYGLPPFVVNTVADDSSGSAGNCPAGGSTTACTLRDALAAASTAGSGNITFSTTVFNTPQTIVTSNGTLNIPTLTSISGVTSGSGTTLQNLVTISGGSVNNGFAAFTVGSGVANASIANLTITDSGSTFAGAIDNFGSLMVQNCTVTGTAGNEAGSIYNNGGTLEISNSTISGNTSGHYGGALYSTSGTVTVIGSTISGNAALFGAGGILLTGGTVNVIGSTVSGNFANLYGPGVYNTHGTLTVANSIVSGNQLGTPASPGNYDDLQDLSGATTFTTGNSGGNLIGYYNANSASAPTPAANLAPLGNYGGPTMTMLPLPGSAAICDGLPGNIAPGVTMDQRGLPNTNSTYPGYSVTACVDAGAVQTNYAIAFTQQPSTAKSTASLLANIAISPAPAVGVTESGVGLSGATVSMTASAGTLAGSISVNTSGETATFNGLSIAQTETGDTLTASLSLNPGLTLTATSYPFDVNFVAPALSAPTVTTLSGATVPFAWTPNSASRFIFRVGTTGPGSYDLYNSNETFATTANLTNVPTVGATLYVRLYYLNGTILNFIDYTFTESGTLTLPTFGTPVPGLGTILGGSSVPFTWNRGSAAAFELLVGTTGAGSYEISKGAVTLGNTATINNVPTGGATLYVRLKYEVNDVWSYIDSEYTESGSITAPQFTFPTGTLAGSSVTFQWNPGSASRFIFRASTTAAAEGDLYNSGETFATSATVNNIPTTGGELYVRLYYEINGVFQHKDYTFIEQGTYVLPQITQPSTSAQLTGSDQTFTWTPGSATLFLLHVSALAPGGSDLYASSSDITTVDHVDVPNLPTNGGNVYVRLEYRRNGVWNSIDYIYQANGTTTTPQLTTPTPGLGTTLSGSTADFAWTANSSTKFIFRVGTTGPGSLDVYNSGLTLATTAHVTGIPIVGATLYVRLYYELGPTTQFIDYVYTENGTSTLPSLTTPTPGLTTTLSGASVPFTWSPGSAAAFYLQVGTTGVGSDDVGNTYTTGSTATVNNIPTAGATLYVRLKYLLNGAWSSIDYQYTEF